MNQPKSIPMPVTHQPAVLEIDFEARPNDQNATDLMSHVGNCQGSTFADRAALASDPDDSTNQIMRVLLPAEQIGSKNSGGQAIVSIPPADEYILNYRMRFGAEFEWTRGGKLPGMASGGSQFTGGTKPDGTGWSARLMWRPNGKLVAYVYHMDQTGKFGDDFSTNQESRFQLQPETWYQITQRIRINSDSNDDGEIQIWVDGRQVLDHRDIQYRSGPNGKIDSLLISAFYGGSTDRFRPKDDHEILFDNFVIRPAGPPE